MSSDVLVARSDDGCAAVRLYDGGNEVASRVVYTRALRYASRYACTRPNYLTKEEGAGSPELSGSASSGNIHSFKPRSRDY